MRVWNSILLLALCLHWTSGASLPVPPSPAGIRSPPGEQENQASGGVRFLGNRPARATLNGESYPARTALGEESAEEEFQIQTDLGEETSEEDFQIQTNLGEETGEEESPIRTFPGEDIGEEDLPLLAELSEETGEEDLSIRTSLSEETGEEDLPIQTDSAEEISGEDPPPTQTALLEDGQPLQRGLLTSEAVAEKRSPSAPVTDGRGRNKKLFFTLVRITPKPCITDDERSPDGICITSTECTKEGGKEAGSCAGGLGVCCIVQRRCGESSSYNNTHFVNPNHPEGDSGSGACSLTIERTSTEVCQMRFDFDQLELSQPDEDGNCLDDFLTVTGGSSAAPTICGYNTGQHIYVDVTDNGGSIRLTVDRTAGTASNRAWDIKVIQIPCESRYQAPTGCLQYYTETSGTITSFNFGPPVAGSGGTRQLSSLQYGACIRQAEGYCGIIWNRNTTPGDYTFTLNGEVPALNPALLGDPASSSRGASCTSDYVIIPDGVDSEGIMGDRYCGLGFPAAVQTSMTPFTLFVKTDADEQQDGENSGFSLNYRQTIC